jgi:hypothetical protein
LKPAAFISHTVPKHNREAGGFTLRHPPYRTGASRLFKMGPCEALKGIVLVDRSSTPRRLVVLHVREAIAFRGFLGLRLEGGNAGVPLSRLRFLHINVYPLLSSFVFRPEPFTKILDLD